MVTCRAYCILYISQRPTLPDQLSYLATVI